MKTVIPDQLLSMVELEGVVSFVKWTETET